MQVKELEAHGRRHGLSASDLSNWMPEYAAYMIEACPGKPFEGIQAPASLGRKLSTGGLRRHIGAHSYGVLIGTEDRNIFSR